ncbi:N-acetylmannosamine kinase [Vibrio nigripulchritudo]|uniref:N-acetylmannosamine kinase n=1 Tax=Vibrio nigripulchritudo TaxID=28173 RepID=UPI0005F9F802|nr:N-acetylmannosamine kinase [Vibrio nigripulchritudo]KJY80138.1 N-acetylmannosamine kinase [Vibrio nigripulchritudo]
MKILAIDIGGTKIAIGLVDLSTQTLTERKQIPTPDAQSADQFVHHIIQHCQEWLPKAEKIGISTTGWVSHAGVTSTNPDTLAFPTPFPLRQAMEALTNKPTSMLNDAQAAAWYEYLQLDQPLSNIAYITISTGVGGGLILDGQLHKGATNFAGHIGHTVINIDGHPCGCGQNGCVEAVASGNAIQRQVKEKIGNEISNIKLFDLAPENPQAQEIINNSAKAIATLCQNLKASLDLDAIVIGGGIGLANGYLETVRHYIQKSPPPFHIPLFSAQGDYDACLLGAAFQFIE